MEYPPLHELTTSKNPVVQALHYYLTNTAPEPHRRSFLKPFMRLDAAEFCASCHKVHLDVPVNKYRWFRGFNEYDNWQASGVSGQGARSFYYPAKSQNCVDCHMPLEKSNDAGNHKGFVHSHRFPAANTAVPFVNQDAGQLRATEDFLKDKQLSVDIFAVSPVEGDLRAPQMRRRASDAQVVLRANGAPTRLLWQFRSLASDHLPALMTLRCGGLPVRANPFLSLVKSHFV